MWWSWARCSLALHSKRHRSRNKQQTTRTTQPSTKENHVNHPFLNEDFQAGRSLKNKRKQSELFAKLKYITAYLRCE
eukprot:m.241082 g.241082  ORF g.241082 m.241082 type:complete len:77 (-) comp17625_c0_seq1:774-1004(-)